MTEPLRVVSIGGGNGLSALLNGLKKYSRHFRADPPRADGLRADVPRAEGPRVDITAIVTVTDDGGSSGRLRREFDVLPPGDIRNCMVALSEDEALLAKLFQYRFRPATASKATASATSFSPRSPTSPEIFRTPCASPPKC